MTPPFIFTSATAPALSLGGQLALPEHQVEAAPLVDNTGARVPQGAADHDEDNRPDPARFVGPQGAVRHEQVEEAAEHRHRDPAEPGKDGDPADPAVVRR